MAKKRKSRPRTPPPVLAPKTRFGGWTVLRYAGHFNSRHCFHCRCDCGRRKAIPYKALVCQQSKSCGCSRANSNKKHGMARSPEFNIWKTIVQRCFNKRRKDYARYGGRGITMHPAWKSDFMAFYRHIGPRPGPRYSVDRWPDNNGSYVPGNVRWATPEEQGNNRRTNRIVRFNNQNKTVTEWARHFGLKPLTVFARLDAGHSIEKALLTPMRKHAARTITNQDQAQA